MDYCHSGIKMLLGLLALFISCYYILNDYQSNHLSKISKRPSFIRLYSRSEVSQNKNLSRTSKRPSSIKLHSEFEVPERNIFIFYNKVHKCGSTSLNFLLRDHAMVNNYSFKMDQKKPAIELISNERVKSLQSWIQEQLSMRTMVFSRHIFYMDMSQFGDQLIYINQLRDPVNRFISGYYYYRDGVKKHYKTSIKINKTKTDLWLNKPIEDCIRDVTDSECSDFSSNRVMRRLYRKTAKPWYSKVLASSVPYFCGMEEFCGNAHSDEAINQAIVNIKKHYLVVGILENMNMTLAVFKHFLPQIFKGVEVEDIGHANVHGTTARRSLDPDTREILKNRLKGEYTLYNFAIERLKNQYNQIQV